jgi:hypothetical protein
METKNKFSVKKNCPYLREPRRVLSVLNLTATDFIPSPPRDKFSKFPVIRPKISRRKSEIIRRPTNDQPTWIAHYREHIARQLNSNRNVSPSDRKKVTFNFCEFLKKKEVEQKKINESQPKDFIEILPARYHD